MIETKNYYAGEGQEQNAASIFNVDVAGSCHVLLILHRYSVRHVSEGSAFCTTV
jgi:hypothetical protein